jgi:hypothetical protein
VPFQNELDVPTKNSIGRAPSVVNTTKHAAKLVLFRRAISEIDIVPVDDSRQVPGVVPSKQRMTVCRESINDCRLSDFQVLHPENFKLRGLVDVSSADFGYITIYHKV